MDLERGGTQARMELRQELLHGDPSINPAQHKTLQTFMASLLLASMNLLLTSLVLSFMVSTKNEEDAPGMHALYTTSREARPPSAPPMNAFVIPEPCLYVMISSVIVCGVVAFGLGAALLHGLFLGFTPIGPAAASAAAGWQSTGAFAGLSSTLQSAAMGGGGIWPIITSGVASGPLVAGAAYAFCTHVCGNCVADA